VQSYNANTVIDSAYVHTDNNYTTAEKSKLAGIEAGAEVNVNADWNATTGDAAILNKPTLGTMSSQNADNVNITGGSITSGMVTSALGYTPYNSTNPSNYITTAGARSAISVTGAGSYDSATGVINIVGGVTSFNTRTGAISLTSGDVTGALGFTPYNSTNPNGYITGITSSNVTTALGYTPYNSSNPSGYITSSALSGYAPLTGTGASGTWGINITGNAATATSSTDNTKLPLAGGTMSGAISFQQPVGLNFANGQYIRDNGSGGLAIYSGAAINLNSSSFVSISGTNTTGLPVIPITVTGSGAFQRGVRMLNSGMGAGDSLMYAVGAADNSKNMGQFYFYYAGSGSNSNRISMGLHSVDDIFNLFGTGNISLGTTSDSGFRLNISGTGNATNDFRAPIFYDSNNTNFYLDPENISSLYGVAVRGDQSPTDSRNQIFFWGSGDTTTSAIGFKSNGGEFPNPTGFGDGYNTYFTMDTDGRGWVFRRGVGGADFNAAYTAGWILNNGVWQANASMRAPIFYDSNDTGYYINPAQGGFRLKGGTSDRVTFETNDSGFLVVNAEGNSVSDMRLGAAWGAPGIYSSSNLYLMCGSSYVYWKLNNVDKGYMDDSANLIAYGSMRAPIFYDYNNTGYYTDPASTSNLNNTISQAFRIGTDSAWKIRGNSGNAELAFEYSTSSTLSDANIKAYFSGSTFVVGGDIRAPIFYDLNSTGYYGDFAGTSRINTITFDQLQSTSYNTPNQLVTASDQNWTYGCFNSGSTYFMQVKFYGTNDDTRGFRVFDTATSIAVWRVNGAGNSIASGNVTAYSDERLKTNWRDMPENFVSRLAQIKVGIYDRIDGSKLTQVGVGAQSLQTLLPQAVDKSDDEMGTLSVNYGSAALASAVELAKEVLSLKSEISELKSLINKLIKD
jgi:hypothetical protein